MFLSVLFLSNTSQVISWQNNLRLTDLILNLVQVTDSIDTDSYSDSLKCHQPSMAEHNINDIIIPLLQELSHTGYSYLHILLSTSVLVSLSCLILNAEAEYCCKFCSLWAPWRMVIHLCGHDTCYSCTELYQQMDSYSKFVFKCLTY